MARLATALAILLVVGSLGLPQVRSDEAKRPAAGPQSYDEARALAAKAPGFKNLQRIGLALHGYHDLFDRFPAAVLYAPDGKTQYSWRVELLPMLKHYVDRIEPEKLDAGIDREQYNQLIRDCGYDIELPWDSPANLELLKSIPEVYRHPADAPDSADSAYYAVVGEGTAFDPKVVVRYDEYPSWLGTALMVVESRSREPWTRPVDIGYSPAATVPRFGGFTQGGFLALSADGAVHYIPDETPPKNIRAFINKDMKDNIGIVGVPYQLER